MRNQLLITGALISIGLTTSCGHITPAQSAPQSTSPKAVIKSQSYSCLSGVPADRYVLSIFGSCSTGYEPIVDDTALAPNVTLCDTNDNLSWALPNDWTVVNFYQIYDSGSCRWLGGNRVYARYTVDSTYGRTKMGTCSFVMPPPGWRRTNERAYNICGNSGSYMVYEGTAPQATLAAATPSGTNGFIENGTGFSVPAPATTTELGTLSVPHACKLQKDGPYLRRQTIPAQSGTSQAPAYSKMVVTLPTANNISINPGSKVSGWIYLGGQSYKKGGAAVDAGLFYDVNTNAFGVGGQTNYQNKTEYFNGKVGNQPFRIPLGSDVIIEFWVNAQNTPMLRITSSQPFQVLNGASMSTYSGPQTMTMPIAMPFGADWRWNPSGSAGGTGQPLKAMVSMAFNDLTSTSQLNTRTEKMVGVKINDFYPGVITGFNGSEPIVRRVAWPKVTSNQSEGYCVTNFVTPSGNPDRFINIDIKMPQAPTDGGGGGGGGGGGNNS